MSPDLPLKSLLSASLHPRTVSYTHLAAHAYSADRLFKASSGVLEASIPAQQLMPDKYCPGGD